MATRVLELTLRSASDLKKVNMVTRMKVYAVVSISDDPLTRQCTPPDYCGGRYPEWNATLRFAVPPTAAAAAAAGTYLHVLLRTERSLGDRDVGEVILPLRELLAGAGDGPSPRQFGSYQVHMGYFTEQRGILNLSYKLGPIVPVPQQPPARADKHVVTYPVALYPPPPPVYPPPPPRGGHGDTSPKKGKKGKFRLGVGTGLLCGAIGGMLLGDMLSDAAAANGARYGDESSD